MRIISFLLMIGLSFITCKTTEVSKFDIQEVTSYIYSEKYNESLIFKVGQSLYIISELVSVIDSLNNKKSVLKKITIKENNSIKETEFIFENKKKKEILDALQFNLHSIQPIDVEGTALDIKEEEGFFYQEYHIPLQEKIKIKVIIQGLEQKSSLNFYANKTLIKTISISDAPNYFIETIDINGDEFKEILLYIARIDGTVELKIMMVEHQ